MREHVESNSDVTLHKENISFYMKIEGMPQTIVANVTEMKTRDTLLKLTSIAVPRAVGTTVKGKVHLWH